MTFSGLAVWRVDAGAPNRIQITTPDLERELETWIEKDPGLIGGALTVVARQFRTNGGKIDLLALDPQGTWVIIEIKRDAVRRETIAQALDYASCIATMDGNLLAEAAQGANVRPAQSEAPRDVRVILVGTSRDPDLDRIVNFLGGHDLPISIVTFNHFREGGAAYLVREITEADQVDRTAGSGASRRRPSLEEVCKLAEANGVLPIVEPFLRAAEGIGLVPQPYARAIMITPPWKRNRMVFTVSADKWKDGRGRVYLDPAPITEFAEVTREEAQLAVGDAGWRNVTVADAEHLARELMRVLRGKLRNSGPHQDGASGSATE